MSRDYDRVGHDQECSYDYDRVISELSARVALLEERMRLVDQHIEFSTETCATEMLRVKFRQSLEKLHEQALLENVNHGAVTWLCSPGTSA